jgi:hypothetical protein
VIITTANTADRVYRLEFSVLKVSKDLTAFKTGTKAPYVPTIYKLM